MRHFFETVILRTVTNRKCKKVYTNRIIIQDEKNNKFT